MEVVKMNEELDPTILTDSGTESFNNSPIVDNLISPTDGTLWNLGLDKHINVKNILDKSISVDEDSLIVPLEPVICATENHSNTTANNLALNTERSFCSILRHHSCCDNHEDENLMNIERKVSFPSDLDSLLTYKDPEPHFKLEKIMSAQEILSRYENSCKDHRNVELSTLKTQILEIKNNHNYSANLNLSNIIITLDVCETLEDIFKVANFRSITIDLNCFSDESSFQEFMNIIEYYSCMSEIVITKHIQELEYWMSFCNIISKCVQLESITLEDITLTDQYIKFLTANIDGNNSITTLKFNRCFIRNLQSLMGMAVINSSIRELYLPQTGLYNKEAEILGRFLKENHTLKLLDISNNLVGDRGMEALSKSLCYQVKEGCGLSVLIIFNNQLTEKSGIPVNNILSECINVNTLNFGYNKLTDEFISKIENGLHVTKSLEGLGLQKILLTDIGISKLADAIQINTSLQKLNLKGNKAVQKEGLDYLSKALTNTKIVKVELDETNRNCDNPVGYMELVQQINGICTVNDSKSRRDGNESDDEEVCWAMTFSRKVSLNCEPVMTVLVLSEPHITPRSSGSNRKKSPSPSPIPSPGCSPRTNRFSVSPVPNETFSTAKAVSRFKVFAVPSVHSQLSGSGDNLANSSPLDEEDEVRFANVRSSFSSIESVDSLSITRDSVYDSTTPSGESD